MVLVRRSRRWILAASVPMMRCSGFSGRRAVAGAPEEEAVVPGSHDFETTWPVPEAADFKRESVPVE